MFDVYTDFRTFFILYGDGCASAYWASFMLASIAAPYLIFWSSRYNFQPAVDVLDEFARLKPQTFSETFAKVYYTLLSLPIVGLLLTTLLIVYWWLAEIVSGLLCKPCYRRSRRWTENVASSFGTQRARSITPLMPYDSMRFFTLSEMFYESFPQLGLQIVIYMSGTSQLYTFYDVCISVAASAVNILLNLRELSSHAHSYGMRLRDFILFFMSASLDNMMKEATPVRLFCVSQSLRECSIMAFEKLYLSNSSVRSICESLLTLETPFHKQLLLPLPRPMMDIPLRRVVRLALFLRAKVHHHDFMVSFDRKLFHDRRILPLITKSWHEKMVLAKGERAKSLWCPSFIQCCRRTMNSASCYRFGDVVLGTEKILIEDILIQEFGKERREFLECEEYVEIFIRYIWPIMSESTEREQSFISRKFRRKVSMSMLQSMTTESQANMSQMALIVCLFLDLRVLFSIVACVRELGKRADALFELELCIRETIDAGVNDYDIPHAAILEHNRQLKAALFMPETFPHEDIIFEVRKVFGLPVQDFAPRDRDLRLRARHEIEV